MSAVVPLVLLMTALTAVAASPARAMEKGIQDDHTIFWHFEDSGSLLDLAHLMGVTRERMMAIQSRSWNSLEAQVDEARAHGLAPQIAIMGRHLYGPPEPDAYAAWAYHVASAFRGRVDRYSILNEPELMFSSGDECTPQYADRIVRSAGYKPLSTTYFVRRKVRKIVMRAVRRRGTKGRKGGKVYKRVRKTYYKRARRHGLTIRATGTSTSTTTGLADACRGIITARKYVRVYRAGYAAIKAADPEAAVLIGETSPKEDTPAFVAEVLREGRTEGTLIADGWAHHPYQFLDSPLVPDRWGWFGIHELPALNQMLRAGGVQTPQGGVPPIYVTEFNYFVPEQPAAGVSYATAGEWMAQAMQVACDNGVREFISYQWDRTTTRYTDSSWEASLLGPSRAITPAAQAFARGGC